MVILTELVLYLTLVLLQFDMVKEGPGFKNTIFAL